MTNPNHTDRNETDSPMESRQGTATSTTGDDHSAALHTEPQRFSWSSLPNLKWLVIGILVTLGFTLDQLVRGKLPPLTTIMVFLPGLAVAFAFLLFNNPREQKNGLHIIISTPFISILWPLFLIMLLATRPWNSKAWTERPRP